MKNFHVLNTNLGNSAYPHILEEVNAHPELWNQHAFRTELPNGPFPDCSDIILQYNDVDIYPRQELETILYPAGVVLTKTYKAASTLMWELSRSRMGRVMVTKLPPEGVIKPHKDSELFTKYYDRFHFCLADNDKTVFRCGDELFKPQPGQVFWFNNALEHEVINAGETDRLTMIVDLKKLVMKKFYGKDESGVRPIYKIDLGASKVNPDVTYAVESFEKMIPEMKEQIIEHHYAEVALSQDVVPLDPDWNQFCAKERLGTLFTVSMRLKGKLIGYFVSTIAGHLHYKSTLHCAVDLYFVRKEFRKGGLGREFFEVIEQELKRRKVVKVITGCKTHRNHTALFESLGYTLSDYMFIKVL